MIRALMLVIGCHLPCVLNLRLLSGTEKEGEKYGRGTYRVVPRVRLHWRGHVGHVVQISFSPPNYRTVSVASLFVLLTDAFLFLLLPWTIIPMATMTASTTSTSPLNK
jgi:hypothetical protein